MKKANYEPTSLLMKPGQKPESKLVDFLSKRKRQVAKSRKRIAGTT